MADQMPDRDEPRIAVVPTRYELAVDEALPRVGDRQLRASVGKLFTDAQAMVTRGEVDLIVLTARRLTCLYVLLTKAGMPEIHGCPVVSDRYLEGSPSLIRRDSRVLFLDDSVVVGTTLSRLYEQWADRVAPGGSLIFRTICADIGQIAGYLFEGIDFLALCQRDSDAVQSFSRDLVLTFFENQLPFFTDFPVTEPVTMSHDAWANYLGDPRWHVADVTGPMFDGDGVRAFAQIPTEQNTREFLSRIPPEVSELLETFKVRTYSKNVGDGVRVVFVPIAMIAACRPSALDRAMDAIRREIHPPGERFGVPWEDSSPTAKHRLIQMYLSACVLADMWEDVARSLGDRGAPLDASRLEINRIRLYFGEETDAVSSAFSAIVSTFQATKPGGYPQPARLRLDEPSPSALLDEERLKATLWDTRELLENVGLPDEPSPGHFTKVGLIFSHTISSIFGLLNREFEVPQRVNIRLLGSREEYRKVFGNGEGRVLNQGFTMRELTSALAPSSLTGSPWVRAAVSLGVDVGNDLGIIVPVTQYDEQRDVVYRCYRLGETAQLADRPLVETVGSSEVDDMASCADRGFPIRDSNEKIDTERILQWRFDASSLEGLRAAVKEAIPGEVLYRFSGVIKDVEDAVFIAVVTDPVKNEQRMARINIDRIPRGQRERIVREEGFTWTAFLRESNRAGEQISRIRLDPESHLDLEELARDAESVASMIDVADESSFGG